MAQLARGGGGVIAYGGLHLTEWHSSRRGSQLMGGSGGVTAHSVLDTALAELLKTHRENRLLKGDI